MDFFVIIFVAVFCVCLGFYLGNKVRSKVFQESVSRLNLYLQTEKDVVIAKNKELQETNAILESRVDLLEQLLLHNFIVEYYVLGIKYGNTKIYTVDAINYLKDLYSTALQRSEPEKCYKNELGRYFVDYLRRTLESCEMWLNCDNYGCIFDGNIEYIINWPFPSITTSLLIDKKDKASGREMNKLSYCYHPVASTDY